jgi:3-methyladenine DNA glycosylase AlkC
MSEQGLMKDGLGPEAVDRIAQVLESVYPEFDSSAFTSDALNGLGNLELKDRVRHLIAVLNAHLPKDFNRTAEILSRVPGHVDLGDEENPLRGFAIWPIIDFVGVHGIDHPDVALPLLKKLTPLFSAEFAIRPFIAAHPSDVLERLEGWVVDPDPHVRRLVSEGTRPRLPWGPRLKVFIEDPQPLIPLLEGLRDDPSEFVRRSVANNLNDIAKDHPDLVCTVCSQWWRSGDGQRKRLVRHALRTLIKNGYPGVFDILGYTKEPKLGNVRLRIARSRILLGENLEFTFAFRSLEPNQRFVVDYAVHFIKANGKTAPKVFKLRNVAVGEGVESEIRKVHRLKPITTRRYYPGEQVLAVQINGREVARAPFHLEV